MWRQKNKDKSGCWSCGKSQHGNSGNFCQTCCESNKHNIICRNIQIKNNQLLRHKKKLMCIDYLGGKCQKCGIDSAYKNIYDIHHIDPSKKQHNLASLLCKKWETIKQELDLGTMLLCVNCHRQQHDAPMIMEVI
jgi:hypothetical protein